MNHIHTHPFCAVPNRVALLLAVPLLAATAAPAIAGCDVDGPFELGARCLFIGHSFFVPVANAFDAVAGQNDFPLHRMDTVFRGGPAGSPEALWDNAATRVEIETVLATGEVDLFGLTSFSPENSDFDDYARWIDLALRYNPETRFFVGIPWAPGGPSLETEAFDAACEQIALDGFEVVDQLRTAYPGEQIEFVAYGKTASVLKAMFEAGELPDIAGLTPDPANGVAASDALFADPLLGHGGPMMLELSALSWMDILYGAGVETLTFNDYQSDVEAIVTQVLGFNDPFQPPQSSVSADLNQDGILDLADVNLFAGGFLANDPTADLNGDGVFDLSDINLFIEAFASGCP